MVDALIEGTETEHFFRFVGAEVHGSRPALEDWRPATQEEATAYIKGCVTRLADFAGRTGDSGIAARDGLGRHLRPLLSRGFIDTVEPIVAQVRSMAGRWTEALEGLGHFLRYDVSQENQELIARIRKLIADLQPQDFETRVRLLVTEMPWDFPSEEELDFEARQERQAEAVHALAVDIVEQPTVLDSVLPGISRGQQRMAIAFGESLAKSVNSSPDWLDRVVSAVVETPEDERNFDLFVGICWRHGFGSPSSRGNIQEESSAVIRACTRIASDLLSSRHRGIRCGDGRQQSPSGPPASLAIYTMVSLPSFGIHGKAFF